ncbi:sirohydrochlorin chelatase [Leifsonia sp. SIMBA_070]|uniref:sirohydrochlorin chelatase n=1 Tax=Leifsonia sp. SIMBA_070 TaxID=3085810 RepID=UPI00397ADC86
MTGAILAASHGTSSPEGRAAVRRLVDAVASRSADAVVGCHVDVEQPDVPTALASVASADQALIVPLLLSAGYHVYVDLAESAAGAPLPASVAPALGPDDRLAAVLELRLREAGYRPGDAVVMAAAGSSDARAVEDCHRQGELLAHRLGVEVVVGFISAVAPSVASAVESARSRHPGARVILANYLLAPGYFADLAAASPADVVAAPLLTPTSTPVQLVEVVLDRIAARAALPA